MILLNNQPTRGQKITYEREIMFKGKEKTTSKIVGILNNILILENGDNIYFFVSY